MGGRLRINWIAALGYWLSLHPWDPDVYRRVFKEEPDVAGLERLGILPSAEERRTFANVARAFGVSRQAVAQAAKRDGWDEAAERQRQAVRWALRTAEEKRAVAEAVAEGIASCRRKLEETWAIEEPRPSPKKLEHR